jgi:hypothetical protein
MVSFPQASPSTPCAHLSPLPYAPHAQPINVLGIERNNDKRIAIEVPIFRSRWLRASWIAGCFISLIQFLSLHDGDFLKRKIFGPWTRCLGLQTTHFLITGQNKPSAYQSRRRSCGLVGRLALCTSQQWVPLMHRVITQSVIFKGRGITHVYFHVGKADRSLSCIISIASHGLGCM